MTWEFYLLEIDRNRASVSNNEYCSSRRTDNCDMENFGEIVGRKSVVENRPGGKPTIVWMFDNFLRLCFVVLSHG